MEKKFGFLYSLFYFLYLPKTFIFVHFFMDIDITGLIIERILIILFIVFCSLFISYIHCKTTRVTTQMETIFLSIKKSEGTKYTPAKCLLSTLYHSSYR